MIKLHLYFTSITWFVLSLLSSTANDIISKYIGLRLYSSEVIFFRFLFSIITLLPFILYYGKNTLKTSHPYIHLIRGSLLFFGMVAWTYGLTITHVTTATVISWVIPLFTMILASFFLNENIIWQRWVVTVVSFVGIVVILNPRAIDFNPYTLIFVAASIAFSILDIINKKYVIEESILSMLFYSALVTAILSMPLTIYYWQTPKLKEIALLFILGGSANLILFFILKAFTLSDITALAPYRYLELIFSSIAAYFIFDEIPIQTTLIGALILIFATLFIIYSEKKVINKINTN